MFFKKHTITELEKSEIVFDYLNEKLVALCADTDFSHPHVDYVSIQIIQAKTEIELIRRKMEILRSIAKHRK